MSMMLKRDRERLANCLREIAADPLAGEFIRDKAKRALIGKPSPAPRNASTYQPDGAE